MSHTVEIEMHIDDLEKLKKAFIDSGWEILENKKIRTYTYDPAKDNLYDFVAVNPQDGFDLGINLVDGEYKIFGDFYDRSIAQQLGANLGLLKQRYNIEKAKAFCDEEELEYELVDAEDGYVDLRVMD